jgi:prepilin-type N-terminal cleavage/methylation domain-containing protein
MRRVGGYSLSEVLVVLTLFSIIMAAISAVLYGQRRFYTAQAVIADTRDAIRIATGVLSGELRDVSPSGGDLYAIAPDSLALRSTLGLGIVCSAGADAIKLWMVTGRFGDSTSDSALVFLEHDFDRSDDDEWVSVDVNALTYDSDGECPSGVAPDLELSVTGLREGITIGSPVRAFRPYVYKLYSRHGHWWLGQRLRSGRLQPVVGPFAEPQDGGLSLEYLTADGQPTDDPLAVAQVRISLKGRRGQESGPANSSAPSPDSLSTIVYLRNSR